MRHYISRVIFAGIAFTLFTAIAVPFMSAYGLQVDPILKAHGLWPGCHYLSLVGGISLGLTALGLALMPGLTPLRGTVAYLASVVIAAVVTSQFFDFDHLILRTRASEVIALMGLFLAVLLAYLLRWVGVTKVPPRYHFKEGWWRGVIAGLTPALMIAVFNMHYIFRLTEFEPEETFLTLLSVTGWMLTAYTLHFITEHRRASIFSWGIESLKEGDLDYRPPTFSGGVWSPLGRLLNDAIIALQERGRLLNGMSRFVSRELAEKVQKGQLEIKGAAVTLTIVVVNLRHFEEIGKKLSGDALIHWLNSYFNELLKIFVKHNLVVAKFVDDGIVAYVDPQGKSGPEGALKAVRAVVEELPRLAQEFSSAGLPPLDIGAGITQGEVILGHFGDKDQRHYTIVGESIARAARLESFAEEYRAHIVVDGNVWEKLSAREREGGLVQTPRVLMHGFGPEALYTF